MSNFAADFKRRSVMTALQLNVGLFHDLSIIAENETMMEKVAKYVRRVARQLTDDPACMTKEEFYARIDEAEREIAEGKGVRMLPDETLDEFLKRVG